VPETLNKECTSRLAGTVKVGTRVCTLTVTAVPPTAVGAEAADAVVAAVTAAVSVAAVNTMVADVRKRRMVLPDALI
jgi:hypothetical protein